MTRALAAAVALTCASAATVASQSRSVFRSGTDVVTVSVTVKKGNSVVGNLTASDFRLFDNDVAQSIEALTIESVPVDVTLFMDTSGSTAGALDRMQRNVRAMAAMLRPADRFRLLTIGLSVYETLPWQPAHRALSLDMRAVPGISLIYDALLVAFAHQPESGRRHLIVALTDGEDCGSMVSGTRMLDVGARSEAVLHVIYVSSSGDMGPHAISAVCGLADPMGPEHVKKAAERSGGGVHRSRFGDPAVRTFSEVLGEFRQSYVLQYSPRGVDGGGWHRVRVDVPGRSGLTIRARNGYFAQ